MLVIILGGSTCWVLEEAMYISMAAAYHIGREDLKPAVKLKLNGIENVKVPAMLILY